MTGNVIYLHSHDTGRYVQPYGHAIPTPNIQWLADQGVMFRDAFCAAPSCSGSRAALVTGEYCHTNGMMGLAHRGFSLYDQRLANDPPFVVQAPTTGSRDRALSEPLSAAPPLRVGPGLELEQLGIGAAARHQLLVRA